MTPLIFALFAIAGGAGSAVRYIVDGVIRHYLHTRFPLATTIINVSGSFILGFITGISVSPIVSEDYAAIFAIGFLGGYTTFSTASFESVQLARNRKYAQAALNAMGMLVAAVALAGLGLWLGVQLGVQLGL